jgi:hypothetical protein
VKRRDLLKTLGLLPVLGTAALANSRPQAAPLQLGLLLPATPAGQRFGAALATASARSGQRFSIQSASTNPHQAAAVAEGWHASARLDLLLSYGEGYAAPLRHWCEAAQVPLIHAEYGVNQSRAEASSALILSNSLRMFEASVALGQYAAQHFGPASQIISTLFEAGFDQINGFQAGVVMAGGHNHPPLVLDAGQDHLAAPLQLLRRERPNSVLLLASGPAAQAIARECRTLGIKLLGLPHGDVAERIYASVLTAKQPDSLHNSLHDPLLELASSSANWLLQGLVANGDARGLLLLAQLAAHKPQRSLVLRQAGRVLATLANPNLQASGLQALQHAPRSGWTQPYA